MKSISRIFRSKNGRILFHFFFFIPDWKLPTLHVVVGVCTLLYYIMYGLWRRHRISHNMIAVSTVFLYLFFFFVVYINIFFLRPRMCLMEKCLKNGGRLVYDYCWKIIRYVCWQLREEIWFFILTLVVYEKPLEWMILKKSTINDMLQTNTYN